MMSYMGGVDADERQLYQDLLVSFANRLSAERAKTADLMRQNAALTERLELLEATYYGLWP